MRVEYDARWRKADSILIEGDHDKLCEFDRHLRARGGGG
jgi:hypothetical protein